MKKKGRLDPYAYIPLNRTKLNRRYSPVGVGVGLGGHTLHQWLKSLPGFFFFFFVFFFRPHLQYMVPRLGV